MADKFNGPLREGVVFFAFLLLSACGDSDSSTPAQNRAPVVTSSASASVFEGSTATGYVASATDADGDSISFSVEGGDDRSAFTINATTGALSFAAAPDFENPADAGGDNVYEVTIGASDGAATSTQAVSITVTDDFETEIVRLAPGPVSSGQSGRVVSSAGDVDGDGRADVLIGNHSPSSNLGGNATLVFGSALMAAENGVFTLSEIPTNNGGVRFSGGALSGRLGEGVSSAGDVDRDGRDDIVLGAFTASPNARSEAGEVYFLSSVFLSQNRGASIDTSSIPTTTGVRILGPGQNERLGGELASFFDYDNDGANDFVIARGPASLPGGTPRLYLLSGETVNSDADSIIDLADFPAPGSGIQFNGILEAATTPAFDQFGASAARLDNLDNDGLPELALQQRFSDTDVGVVIIFGLTITGNMSGEIDDDALANNGQGVFLRGIPASERIQSISSADIDGDGLSDVIIGADFADPNGLSFAGATYVIFGSAIVADADGDLDIMDAIANGQGVVLGGGAANSRSGASVAGLPDVNGDGHDEVVIGAPTADTKGLNSGEVYIVSGSAIANDADGFINLDTVGAAISGVRIEARSAPSHLGISVSVAGDINGDDLPEIIVGANTVTPPGATGSAAGESYVISGRLIREEMITGDGVIDLATAF